jgi:hypothetical protein
MKLRATGRGSTVLDKLIKAGAATSTWADRTPQAREAMALAIAIDCDDPVESTRRMDRGWFEILSLTVVDAVIARDAGALGQVDALLRRAHRDIVRCEAAIEEAADTRMDLGTARRAEGWLMITMEFVRSAQRRVVPVTVAVGIAGTHRERFLRVVSEHPRCNSRTITEKLARLRDPADGRTSPIDEGQLSKIGSKLRADGLVSSMRTSGGLSWELTPRGRSVLEVLDRDAEPTAKDSPAVGPAQPPSAVVLAVPSSERPPKVRVQWGDGTVIYQRTSEPDTYDEPVEEVAAAVEEPPLVVLDLYEPV